MDRRAAVFCSRMCFVHALPDALNPSILQTLIVSVGTYVMSEIKPRPLIAKSRLDHSCSPLQSRPHFDFVSCESTRKFQKRVVESVNLRSLDACLRLGIPRIDRAYRCRSDD